MIQVIDLLNDAVRRGETLFGFELLPPLKGDGKSGIFKAIDNVIEYNPAYINITFHREGLKATQRPDGGYDYHVVRKRPGTVGIAASIQNKYDIPAVPHIICGGMSKYDIEDALIDMDFLGINNVLALRGDPRHYEKQFIPVPNGHSHAVDLIRQIRAMNRGEFIDGEADVCHHSKFCIGVAGYPEKHSTAESLESDIEYLKMKVDSGAEYVVTQMFFDNEKYFRYVELCREKGIDVPIIPGLKPLVNGRQIESLPETFSINIPEELRKAVEDCKGDKEKIRHVGLEWSIHQSKDLMAHGVPALHFYTMSRTESIAYIARHVF